MKRFCYIILPVLFSFQGFSQFVSNSFTLNEEIPANENRDYLANEYIHLIHNYPEQDGFSAKPDPGYEVNLAIDPHLIITPPPSFGGTPDNNTGGVVGTLPGELQVNDIGGLNYKVDLNLPPGISGISPKIGFTYNSYGGDGIMGKGWSIIGISKISRVPYSYYYNNFTNSVVLSNEDQLMIDGNYLIQVENNEYRSEVESFDKIIPINGDINNGFIVLKGNGLTYYYGKTEDSRYYLQNSGTPIAWYVSEIRDLNNNYIEFHYVNNKTEGSFYPDYIAYTGNHTTGQSPFYRIEFNYQSNTRQDTPKKYFAVTNKDSDVFARLTKLLSSVTISHIPSGKLIREYKIYYNNVGDLGRPRVEQIYQYPGEQNKRGYWYNPTIFNWNCQPYMVSTHDQNVFIDSYSGQQMIHTDLFGTQLDDNPLSDILHLSKVVGSNYTLLRAYRNYSFNTPNDFNLNFYDNPGYSHYFYDHNLFIKPGDFDGDGRDEILRISQSENSFFYQIGYFDIENGGIYVEGEKYYFSADNLHDCIIGDFTGNGFDDMCLITGDNPNNHFVYFLSNEDGMLHTIVTNANVTSGGLIKKVLTGDFNGNLKTELMVATDQSAQIVTLLPDNSSFRSYMTEDDFCQINNENTIVSGDFNNDAKSDILMLKQGSTNNWIFYLSTGLGGFNKQEPITSEYLGSNEMIKFAIDVNGDQYCDISLIYKEPESPQRTNFYRKDFLINPRNNGIEVLIKDFPDPITYRDETTIFTDRVHFCMGNFSGSSNSQILASRVYLGSNHISYWGTLNLTGSILYPNIDAINKITNGFGVIKKMRYWPVLAQLHLNKKSSNSSRQPPEYPLGYFQGCLNVVAEIQEEVDQDKYISRNYYYFGGKTHKIGKGFIGFDQTIKVNNLVGQTTKKFFRHDNIYYHHYNHQTSVYSFTDQLISEKTVDYDFRDMNDPEHIRYFPFVKKVVKHTYDLDGSFIRDEKIKYNDYDQYGNPQLIKKWFGVTPGTYDIGEDQSISYKNLINGELYILGLIDESTTTNWKVNTPEIVRKRQYEYYEATNGLLKKEIIEPGNAMSYWYEYTYDEGSNTFGNLTEKKLCAPGMDERVTSYTYSTNGRFIIEKSNPEGHTENYTYDDQRALLTSETDINSLTTYYEYDPFGEIHAIQYPNGNFYKTSKVWSIYGTQNQHEDADPNASYYIWEKNSGQAEKLRFKDQFNRDVRIVDISLEGKKIYNDKTYFNTPIHNGLLLKESYPYFKEEASKGNEEEPRGIEYTYDDLRRYLSITHSDGSTESYEYNNNIITKIGLDGQKKKTFLNAAGWVKKVIDNDLATINYTYRSDGLVKTIMVNDPSYLIEKTYDDFGRVVQFQDPNKGLITYEYNAFGDMISKTDELSTNHYEYDKLGRTIERTSPEALTVWQYDTQIFGVGKIHGIAHAPYSGQVKLVHVVNRYDKYGNLSSLIQEINGKPLKFKYEYDVFGRLKKTSWPSGYETINYYNDRGYHSKIADNQNHILWTASETDPWGLLKKCKLGEDISYITERDLDKGYITDQKAGYGGLVDNIQNMHYEWKTDGNLHSREDLNKNLKERFEYDEFNRLIKSYVNEVPQLNLEYEPNGNISRKSDVCQGNYLYDMNDKPNAIKQIEESLGVVNESQQDIIYTSFDKVQQISEGDHLQLDLYYGSEHERVLSQFENTQTGATKTKRFFNYLYEEETDENNNKKQIHYLTYPNGGIFGIFTVQNEEMTNLNYILRDHLGSLNYVLDEDGGVVQEVNFDAWGRRRNPGSWTYYENNDDPPELMFSRGFTSHEHLDEFQLINMNGRIYDPIIARFLSPDPIVQLPEYSQNFNRYSYVLNNPLRFTDPSGFLVKADTTGGNKSNPYGILNFPAKKEWLEDKESSFDVEDIQKGKAEKKEEPNYTEQSFLESGFQSSWISAEGVGAAGGFFYSMNGKVFKNYKGKWYVYASASAWAPAAEIQSDAITYYSSISVLENGKPKVPYSGNLQIWDPNVTRIDPENFTYIGYGYMPLPAKGKNISVEIVITYNMYKWWNGSAFPKTPYVYIIKF